MKKALTVLFATAFMLAAITSARATTGFLKIHMLNAGDGRADCFLIELPDNTKMVVDIPDGWDTMLINKLNALGFGGGIKYLVGSHEHVDHIGGMDDFINSGFNINNTQMYYPKGAINSDGQHYLNLASACSHHGLTINKMIAGQYIINQTYNGLAFKVRAISPESSTVDGGSDDWQSENEASLVLKVTYGNKSILMQGDAYGSVELSILAGPYASEINLCQVLKVGHHGVNANGAISCREAYLDAAGVNKALITNGYLSIDPTIVSRLQARNIHYFSTGHGDGYNWLSTDGTSNWVESEAPMWP
ncbi:MAG: ComEC/Rec2 family competence protein [Limisphaerales bacterium]